MVDTGDGDVFKAAVSKNNIQLFKLYKYFSLINGFPVILSPQRKRTSVEWKLKAALKHEFSLMALNNSGNNLAKTEKFT